MTAISILTDKPWILSGYRQIVTGYFSVCEAGYVSIYLTNNFHTNTFFSESTNVLQPVDVLQEIRLFLPVYDLSTTNKKKKI